MIEIKCKEDIIIPFEKIGDDGWIEKSRLIHDALLASWGVNDDFLQRKQSNDEEIKAIEDEIGVALPAGLKLFYKTFGIAQKYKEEVLGLITPLDNLWALADASKYIESLSKEDMELYPHLVVFSDYPDTGRLFCFHAETQEIYLFDAAKSPCITKLCDNIDAFIRFCIIYCQSDLFADGVKQEVVENWIKEILSVGSGALMCEIWEELNNDK